MEISAREGRWGARILPALLVIAAFGGGWLISRHWREVDRAHHPDRENAVTTAAESGCTTCGANRPRTLSDPIIPRQTVCVREYFARVGELGPLPQDVEEIKAILLPGRQPDDAREDAAIFALRAGATWLAEPIEPALAADLLAVLYDACKDPRGRVRACAERLMNQLDGDA
ncbi:MAG TPA: hypothetical protein VK176_10300 [Phycisphaerales bacterium]|nr:hypothetical protein [Phycisphaerales bacterium]